MRTRNIVKEVGTFSIEEIKELDQDGSVLSIRFDLVGPQGTIGSFNSLTAAESKLERIISAINKKKDNDNDFEP